MRKYLLEFSKDARILFIIGALLLDGTVSAVTRTSYWTWGFLVLGIAAFFLGEYFVHRFILHDGFMPWVLPKGLDGHREHHDFPAELRFMLSPNRYNIPGYVILWVIVFAVTRSVNLSFAFVTGIGVYQLHYEWTHFVSHRPIIPLTPWGKALKRHHLLHHYQSTKNWYGVTTSCFDTLLGSNPDWRSVNPAQPESANNSNASISS
ncbi:MAG: hypothetical protein JWN30_363 [Bacilli bacterium]|nr:hypothetical protein [Bacilli bacterium]